MQLSESVKSQITKNFDLEAAIIVISELENASFPLAGLEYDRIHHAVIFLSEGNLELFRSAVIEAKIDWRDVLVWSGLGNANWSDVIKKRCGKSTQNPTNSQRMPTIPSKKKVACPNCGCEFLDSLTDSDLIELCKQKTDVLGIPSMKWLEKEKCFSASDAKNIVYHVARDGIFCASTNLKKFAI